MRRILVTGAAGFLGRNLVVHLQAREDVSLFQLDRANSPQELDDWAAEADVVFHLAGVNRPENVEEFQEGNVEFTAALLDAIKRTGNRAQLIFSSSIQAAIDNPYGRSKRRAEEILTDYAAETGAVVSVFRLKNLFGKWCSPNYNSVTATFCHRIARDLPIDIRDPDCKITLAHVDDVVEAFLTEMDERPARNGVLVTPDPIPDFTLTLGELGCRIKFMHQMQKTQLLPDFSSRFDRQLYGTYLSYLPQERWQYAPSKIHADNRGNLAELLKSPQFGQVFVSRTNPGVTRGNHYHHTKTEKFVVIGGEGLIRLRHIHQREVTEFRVRGEDYRIVEIPPGYTHSITNTGTTEMITLFWACEMFDPDHPDTYPMPVLLETNQEMPA